MRDIPIDQTGFANDPEFPAKSANLSELLSVNNNKYNVYFMATNEILPESGIIVAETYQSSDLKQWIGSISDSTIPCGGSDFFISLLEQKSGRGNNVVDSEAHRITGLSLYVAGSTADMDDLEIVKCPIPCNLSSSLELTQECQGNWQNQIGKILSDKNSVAMVVDKTRSIDLNVPAKLKKLMASVVQEICQRYEIDNVIISGGSTASAIVRAIGLHEMNPVFEYDTGVVSLIDLQKDKPMITVKPGSYPWPAELIN